MLLKCCYLKRQSRESEKEWARGGNRTRHDLLDFSASNAYAAAGECNVLCMCYIQWRAPRMEGDFNVSLEEEEKLFHFFFFSIWGIFFILLFYRVIYNIFHAHSHTKSVQLTSPPTNPPTHIVLLVIVLNIFTWEWEHFWLLFSFGCSFCTMEYFIIYSHLFQRKRNHFYLQWK